MVPGSRRPTVTAIDLSGKTALVTGGGQGLGAATAAALAGAGAHVVVNYFDDAGGVNRQRADEDRRGDRAFGGGDGGGRPRPRGPRGHVRRHRGAVRRHRHRRQQRRHPARPQREEDDRRGVAVGDRHQPDRRLQRVPARRGAARRRRPDRQPVVDRRLRGFLRPGELRGGEGGCRGPDQGAHPGTGPTAHHRQRRRPRRRAHRDGPEHPRGGPRRRCSRPSPSAGSASRRRSRT